MERANVSEEVDGGQMVRCTPWWVSDDGDVGEADVRCGWGSRVCVPQVRNGQVCMGK